MSLICYSVPEGGKKKTNTFESPMEEKPSVVILGLRFHATSTLISNQRPDIGDVFTTEPSNGDNDPVKKKEAVLCPLWSPPKVDEKVTTTTTARGFYHQTLENTRGFNRRWPITRVRRVESCSETANQTWVELWTLAGVVERRKSSDVEKTNSGGTDVEVVVVELGFYDHVTAEMQKRAAVTLNSAAAATQSFHTLQICFQESWKLWNALKKRRLWMNWQPLGS